MALPFFLMLFAALIATGLLVALFSAVFWLGRMVRLLATALQRMSIRRELRRAGLLFEHGPPLSAYSKYRGFSGRLQ
jgi:hypothetical protein